MGWMNILKKYSWGEEDEKKISMSVKAHRKFFDENEDEIKLKPEVHTKALEQLNIAEENVRKYFEEEPMGQDTYMRASGYSTSGYMRYSIYAGLNNFRLVLSEAGFESVKEVQKF
jgi:hypothetical protein